VAKTNSSKEITEIYEELCSYENLEQAFKGARRGKTQKDYVVKFGENLKENLLQLKMELLLHIYKPKPLKTFILRDPKTRKISKSEFRDRVIHHAVCNVIEDFFERSFIHDSYANRIGKGTFNAIKRFDKFKRKVSKNNTIKCFVLKADIRHYFDCVDHEILLSLLEKKIKDKRVLWLIRLILTNHKTKIKGKGMPLGNLTSQFFANVYLNELDQFVKHKLRAKYYIRYVDDFVILHQSKNILIKYQKEIEQFLQTNLELQLHPEKSQILKLEKGVSFLGFRIFYHHKLINKKNIRKFEKKLTRTRYLYKRGKIDREKAIEKFEGWLAYITQANTHKYKKKLTSQFNNDFPFRHELKIDQVKKHENLNQKIENSNVQFSQQKTQQLFKKGLTIKEIAKHRNLKENTIWEHLSSLIEHHQIKLKEVLPNNKIKKILKNINSHKDKLKEIKQRINDDSISYNEINCVLANLKGKHKKKSFTYFIQWYQKTNCYKKCYKNKEQMKICREKFQILISKCPDLEFTKREFLDFFNSTNICILPNKEKKRFVSWKEFKQIIE